MDVYPKNNIGNCFINKYINKPLNYRRQKFDKIDNYCINIRHKIGISILARNMNIFISHFIVL